jgi:hypothetical protein
MDIQDVESSANKRPHPELDQNPSPSKKAADHHFEYEKSSPSTKNRRVLEIVNNFHPDAILRAAIKVLQNQGHKDASRVLEKIQKDPNDLSHAQSFIDVVSREKGKIPSVITPARALHHKLEIGLSTRQYDKTAKLGNPESIAPIIWPPGNQLKKESDELRPEVNRHS